MKKNTLRYIEENNKYYEYYIKREKKQGAILNSLAIAFMTSISMFWIRRLFLEMTALKRAGTIVIENQEVMEWVEKEVSEQQFKGGFWVIAAEFFFIFAFLMWIKIRVKNYELYKKRWVKFVPTVISLVISMALLAEYGGENFLLIVITYIQLIPLTLNFIMLLPLEFREEQNFVIKILSFISDFIIKNL